MIRFWEKDNRTIFGSTLGLFRLNLGQTRTFNQNWYTVNLYHLFDKKTLQMSFLKKPKWTIFTSAVALLAKMLGLIAREKQFWLKSFIWQFSAFITLKHFAKFQKKLFSTILDEKQLQVNEWTDRRKDGDDFRKLLAKTRIQWGQNKLKALIV